MRPVSAIRRSASVVGLCHLISENFIVRECVRIRLILISGHFYRDVPWVCLYGLFERIHAVPLSGRQLHSIIRMCGSVPEILHKS